jgi:exonuclease SbcD
LEAFLRNFDTIIDYVLDNDVELFIIAGDIYKTRSPSNTEQEEFAKRIARLGKADQQTLISTGNHDLWVSRGAAHTVAAIKALAPDSVRIIDEPEMVTVGNTKLGVMPYIYRQRLGVKTNADALLYYEKKLNEFRSHGATILVGHQTVEGSKMPAGYAALDNLTEIVVPQKYLQGFDFCVYGHIHEYQVMSTSPLTLYTGPLERIDFSQSGKPVGFVVYDTSTKEHEFIELPAADLYYVKVDLTTGTGDVTQRVLDKLDGARLPNSIVTVSIKIRETDRIKLNTAAIEMALEGAKFSAGLKIDVERAHTSRDEQINETMSAEDALRKYIGGREDLEDIATELIKRGADIIKTCT